LLRSLLDEVSLALSTRSASARSTLERIWQGTGRPERGGLNVWRPYEQMDWPMQEAMLHAAATALQLAADGLITARGALGSALRPAAHRHVYDGDQPSQHAARGRRCSERRSAATLHIGAGPSSTAPSREAAESRFPPEKGTLCGTK